MEHIKNNPETFFREIRQIEIYDYKSLSFEENFIQQLPKVDPVIIFDIPAEHYSRKISTKKQTGSYFWEPDITFPLLDTRKLTIDICNSLFNTRRWMVVLVSNTAKTIIGNDREPLTIDFIDGIVDNNSGNDDSTINITGQTIIMPKIQNL